jgi:hypothetical protein
MDDSSPDDIVHAIRSYRRDALDFDFDPVEAALEIVKQTKPRINYIRQTVSIPEIQNDLNDGLIDVLVGLNTIEEALKKHAESIYSMDSPSFDAYLAARRGERKAI